MVIVDGWTFFIFFYGDFGFCFGGFFDGVFFLNISVTFMYTLLTITFFLKNFELYFSICTSRIKKN